MRKRFIVGIILMIWIINLTLISSISNANLVSAFLLMFSTIGLCYYGFPYLENRKMQNRDNEIEKLKEKLRKLENERISR